MTTTVCPQCHLLLLGGGTCPVCARRARYGLLAVAVLTVWESEREDYEDLAGVFAPSPGPIGLLADAHRFYLDALDALASVMEERQRLIRQHRRELNDEIQAGEREARSAYREGRAEGRSDASK